MVTPFAAQILFKTKLAVIRTVTMCWKHPHPLSRCPILSGLHFSKLTPGFMGNFRRLLILAITHPQVSLSEIFFLQMKHTSYLIQMVYMWKIQHPRGGLITGPWMVWKYQSKEHWHQWRAKPHRASNAGQLLWPWWHDSISSILVGSSVKWKL